MPALDVLVLGPLRVLLDGEDITPGSRKLQALLAVLAVAGRPVRRAELAELVWGEGGLRNLRQAIYSLRQLPGAAAWLDAEGAERLAVRAVTDLDHLGEDLQSGRYEAARARLRGPVLEGLNCGLGVAFDDWLSELQARVDHVAAPLDELPDEAPLRVAQALALCPSPPEPALLSALLGLSSAEVLAATEALERDRMLGPLGLTPRAAAQVRAQTSALTAAALHGRLAELQRAEAPAAAAHHFEAAGAHDAAAECWRRSGELDAALRCARSPSLRVALFAEALDAAETGGDLGRSAALLAELQAFARRSGAPAVVGEASVRAATAAQRAGRRDEAHDLAVEAEQLAEAHGLPALRARAAVVRGQALIFAGQLAAAEAAFRLAADGAPATVLRARAGLGAVAGMRGDAVAAEAHHRGALLLARGLDDRRLVARLSLNLGCDLERLGRDRAAAARFVEAAQHAAELDDYSVQFVALINRATCELHLGALGAAAEALRAAEALPRGVWPGDAGLLAAGWGELERAVGRPEACAAAHAEAALRFAAVGDERRAALAAANEGVALVLAGALPLEAALGRLHGGLIQPAADGVRLELALVCVARGVDPAPVLAGRGAAAWPPRFVALATVIDGLLHVVLGGEPPSPAELSAAVEGAGELAPLARALFLHGDRAAAGAERAHPPAVLTAVEAAVEGLDPSRAAAYRARIGALCALLDGPPVD